MESHICGLAGAGGPVGITACIAGLLLVERWLGKVARKKYGFGSILEGLEILIKKGISKIKGSK